MTKSIIFGSVNRSLLTYYHNHYTPDSGVYKLPCNYCNKDIPLTCRFMSARSTYTRRYYHIPCANIAGFPVPPEEKELDRRIRKRLSLEVTSERVILPEVQALIMEATP